MGKTFIYKTPQECVNLEVSRSHFAQESYDGFGHNYNPGHMHYSRTFEMYKHTDDLRSYEALKKAITCRGFGASLGFHEDDKRSDYFSGSTVFPVYIIHGRPYLQTQRVWPKEGHVGFESLGSWLECFDWDREPDGY